METLYYIWGMLTEFYSTNSNLINIGIFITVSGGLILAIIIGVIKLPQVMYNIFWWWQKRKTAPRTETAKSKTRNKDDNFATNETDYQRKILLLNKLKELEPLIKEFKDILQSTPVSSISAEPPLKQDDM